MAMCSHVGRGLVWEQVAVVWVAQCYISGARMSKNRFRYSYDDNVALYTGSVVHPSVHGVSPNRASLPTVRFNYSMCMYDICQREKLLHGPKGKVTPARWERGCKGQFSADWRTVLHADDSE